MSYNEELDSRIADLISDWGTTRKKVFGGTCYLINGNMMCGVHKDCLILRLGESQAEEAFKHPYVRPFDITGKPMKGWVMVEEAGFQGSALGNWLKKAQRWVKSLPVK